MILYMRYVDAKNKVSVQSHQVWDRDRFVETRKSDWKKEGGMATEVNRDVYREHNWSKS
jgi:hypothetical protein